MIASAEITCTVSRRVSIKDIKSLHQGIFLITGAARSSPPLSSLL
jgi:hypothetical protein